MDKTKTIKKKCFVDVGSHGHIFEFSCGPVAERYPTLLNVYNAQITPDLVEAEITYKVTRDDLDAKAIYERFVAEQLDIPEVKTEYDALQPQYDEIEKDLWNQ